MNIETPIQKLIDNGTLSHDGGDEFSIDALRHKARTGYGRQTITYTLRIDGDADAGERYQIEEDSEMQGSDTVFCTDDASEVAAWIADQMEEAK